MNGTIKITAIVTAYQRIEQTLTTLERIRSCKPAPDETLVHVDGSQTECEAAIRKVFPDFEILKSETCVGPGGSRAR